MISIHADIQDLNFLSYENMCACKSICPAPAFRYLEVNFRYLETVVMGSYEPLRSVMAMEPRFSARTANTLNCWASSPAPCFFFFNITLDLLMFSLKNNTWMTCTVNSLYTSLSLRVEGSLCSAGKILLITNKIQVSKVYKIHILALLLSKLFSSSKNTSLSWFYSSQRNTILTVWWPSGSHHTYYIVRCHSYWDS